MIDDVYGGCFCVDMVGGVGIGGGFMYDVMYVVCVCLLVCYVVRNCEFNVYVISWSEECK